jgi:dTDP-4-amino-4,6-dideoxygalactose transaminase
MKLYSIGLLPNFEDEEFALTRELLFSKKKSYKKDLNKFHNSLASLLNVGEDDVFLMDSARSSFFLALKALGLKKGSEVLLPGFTCIVVVNPVLWAGLKPVYVDISKKNFNCAVGDLLAKVTNKTKVILVQHTFGDLVDVDALRDGLKKMKREDIVIIEDLAHVLSKDFELKGDLAIATFGYEKVISTIRGGALIVNSKFSKKNQKKNQKNKEIFKSLQKEYQELPDLPGRYVKRLLWNPLIWRFILKVYNLGIGKLTLGRFLVKVAHKLGLMGIAIDECEYKGGKPSYLPAKFPAKLASLGSMQLKKLDKLNTHRRQTARAYSEQILKTRLGQNIEQQYIQAVFEHDAPHTFLRYPLLLETKKQRDFLFQMAKYENIILGDWYKKMFYTDPDNLDIIGYNKGTCPVAEEVARKIINLPTSIKIKGYYIDKITQLVKDLDEQIEQNKND